MKKLDLTRDTPRSIWVVFDALHGDVESDETCVYLTRKGAQEMADDLADVSEWVIQEYVLAPETKTKKIRRPAKTVKRNKKT